MWYLEQGENMASMADKKGHFNRDLFFRRRIASAPRKVAE
jgi:hypothetical protein